MKKKKNGFFIVKIPNVKGVRKFRKQLIEEITRISLFMDEWEEDDYKGVKCQRVLSNPYKAKKEFTDIKKGLQDIVETSKKLSNEIKQLKQDVKLLQIYKREYEKAGKIAYKDFVDGENIAGYKTIAKKNPLLVVLSD